MGVYSLGLLCLEKEQLRKLIKSQEKSNTVAIVGSANTVDAQHYLMILKSIRLNLPLGFEIPPKVCLAHFQGIAA